VKYKYRL